VGMLTGMRVEHADVIASVTFLAILATIVIQASSTEWVAKRLGVLETQDKNLEESLPQ